MKNAIIEGNCLLTQVIKGILCDALLHRLCKNWARMVLGLDICPLKLQVAEA